MRKIIPLLIFSATLCLASGCARRSGITNHKEKIEKKIDNNAPQAQRPSKKVELMTIDEAREAARYFKEVAHDKNLALALERVILLTGDTQELSSLMHELAALHEKLGNYEDAGTVYEQYTRLYPGNQDISYMTYKMLDILSKQIVDVRHDQSKIRQLTEQTEIFLSRFGTGDHYYKQVANLRNRGYQLLAQSELIRAQFYLDRYYYTEKLSALRAAGRRLEEAEKVLANLSFDPQLEKSIETSMDGIRAEDFDKQSPTEQIARITKALEILAPPAGQIEEQKSAATLFKGIF